MPEFGSGPLNLAAWEPYALSRATKAQSLERRWRQFLGNERVSITRMYIPVVLAALQDWYSHRHHEVRSWQGWYRT